MEKKYIIGISATATAGLLFGGFLYFSGDKVGPRLVKEENAPAVSEEDKAKIEELYRDELKDEEKYSFCLGEVKIAADYSEPILHSSGHLEHNSKEILLYDKEADKMYILAREVEYKYNGIVEPQIGLMNEKVPVNESGRLSEAYGRNEMPIRIDYANGYIFTDPETKKKNWVYSRLGTVSEMVGSRTGCPGIFKLDNAPGKDFLADREQVLINRECKEKDVSGSYNGSFTYSCTPLDYEQAFAKEDDIRIQSELDSAKQLSEESGEDPRQSGDSSGADSSAGINDGIKSASPDNKKPEDAHSEEVRKILEQFGTGIDASQRGQKMD